MTKHDNTYGGAGGGGVSHGGGEVCRWVCPDVRQPFVGLWLLRMWLTQTAGENGFNLVGVGQWSLAHKCCFRPGASPHTSAEQGVP